MIIEFVLMFVIVASTLLALVQKDLMRTVIIIGFQGLGLALLYQRLLAADVAITQAILGSALLPGLIAVTVFKTRRSQE
ncbi:MAG: hydrogenase subunit MbhD domain-containing protein [Candidatus Methanofastidiosia archaeon]